jgi:hypothetical protein
MATMSVILNLGECQVLYSLHLDHSNHPLPDKQTLAKIGFY